MTNTRTIQIIYYDPADEQLDGCGWNMVDEGAFASRYLTVEDAVATARSAHLPYIVIGEGVSVSEIIETLANNETLA